MSSLAIIRALAHTTLEGLALAALALLVGGILWVALGLLTGRLEIGGPTVRYDPNAPRPPDKYPPLRWPE